MSYQIPVWIDCDPGHDDAIAILMASNLPSWFNLVGISTVHGNAPLTHTTANALSLIEAFRVEENPFDEPVFNKKKALNSNFEPTSSNADNKSNSYSSFSKQTDLTAKSLDLQKPSLNKSQNSTSSTGNNSLFSDKALKKSESIESKPPVSHLSVLASDSATKVSAAVLSAEEALFRKRNLPINVFAGAVGPLSRANMGHAPEIHGESGLDGTNLLPVPRKKAIWTKSGVPSDPPKPYQDNTSSKKGNDGSDSVEIEENAAVAGIAAAVRQYPGEIAIVATGALTNIAQFATRYKNLIPQVRVLSIMGGGFGIGNVTPFAEFNLWCDPEAAQIVLGSKAKVMKEEIDPITGEKKMIEVHVQNELTKKTVLLPLNMTHKAIATKDIREKILNQGLGSPPSNCAASVKAEALEAQDKLDSESEVTLPNVSHLSIENNTVQPTGNNNSSLNTVDDSNDINNTTVSTVPTDSSPAYDSSQPYLSAPALSTNYVRRMIYDLLEFFSNTYQKQFGEEFACGPPVHDPLALVALLPLYFPGGGAPALKMKYVEYAMDIVTDRDVDPKDGQSHAGEIIVKGEDRENGVRVVESMDINVFWNLVLESLDVLDRKIIRAFEREHEEKKRCIQ